MKFLIILSSVLLTANANSACYGPLGCLNTGPPFSGVFPFRPYIPPPQSREEVGTIFIVNSPSSPAAYDYISADDLSSISNSNLNPNLYTKVIVHGYTESGFVQWMTDMKDAFMQAGNYNVIRVSWSKGSRGLYSVSSSNTRIVGAEISYLMDRIREVYPGSRVADPATWHIIGHSLGSHVSGYAGERQNGLGRITGMDPAGPYFEGTDIMVRIDPSDANLVDAIHTDSDPIWTIGLGIHMEVGHMDFYVNGGREQPGCDQGIVERIIFDDESLWGAGVLFVACNHLRSYEYFTESILGCPFGSRMATSLDYDEYFVPHHFYDENSGAKMGFYADQYRPAGGVTNVKYMCDTLDSAPYCAFQHRAHIFFDDQFLSDDAVGDIYLRLKGNLGEDYQKVGTGTYKPGSDEYFPVDLPINVGDLIEVCFYWEFDPAWYKPWEWSVFDNPDIYVSHIDLESLEFFSDYNFCGSSDKIKSNKDIRCFQFC